LPLQRFAPAVQEATTQPLLLQSALDVQVSLTANPVRSDLQVSKLAPTHFVSPRAHTGAVHAVGVQSAGLAQVSRIEPHATRLGPEQVGAAAQPSEVSLASAGASATESLVASFTLASESLLAESAVLESPMLLSSPSPPTPVASLVAPPSRVDPASSVSDEASTAPSALGGMS